MAVNEAPEKIYVHVKKGRILNTWNSEWIGVNDIEYTRTDAFIEKAKKWFEEQNEWCDINGIKHCDMESFEDFRKCIEGE
jgi:hypothetical protein